MLITFKSNAGDITMFGDIAERLLNIIGMNLGREGVIRVEQIPEAITRLKQAAADKAQQSKKLDADERPQDDKDPVDEEEPVSLAVRAVPLIQLLERSQEEKSPVTWGC